MGLMVGGLVVALGVVMLVAGMTHSGASIFQTFTGKAPAGAGAPAAGSTPALYTPPTPTLPAVVSL